MLRSLHAALHGTRVFARMRALTPATALSIAVFVLGMVALSPLILEGPNPFDEGFIVSGAMMIREGWLPVRDFYVIYGPAQYYWIAGLFEIFGEDLSVSRVMHVLTLALLGASIAAGTLLLSPTRTGWAAATSLVCVAMIGYIMPTPLYPAIPAVLLLIWSVWGFSRWFATGSWWALLTTSTLVGLAGLFRWDFGVFGLFAHVVAACAVTILRTNNLNTTILRVGVCLAVPWLLLMLFGFASFILLGDWQRWVIEVPRFALFEFETWRGVQFVLPTWEKFVYGWRSPDYRVLSHTGTELAFVAATSAIALSSLILATQRGLQGGKNLLRADAVALILSLLCLLLLNQMRVRPGLGQGLPSFVVSLPLTAYLLSGGVADSRWIRTAKGACACLLFLALSARPTFDVVTGLHLVYSTKSAWVELPKASSTRVSTLPLVNSESGHMSRHDRWSNYAEMIRYIHENTEPTEPIFSGVADTSRLWANDAMLYFLADRPSATRWIEMEPGLTNTVAGQRELISELERAQVRLVVLWNKTSNEPNATARSNGVHLLDTFVRENFESKRRFGEYEVLVRRDSSSFKQPG